MAQEARWTDDQQRNLETGLADILRADDGLKDTFCKCWDCAKRVLGIILRIPGLPAVVATVLNAIIKAGDIAHGIVCR